MPAALEPPQAERILADLASHPPPLAQPAVPPSSFQGTRRSEALRRDWTHTAWAQTALRREFVSTAAMWVLVLLIWAAVFSSPKRAPMELSSAPTLREATRVWVGGEIVPHYDQLVMFVRSTLPMLYDFTPDGSPFRPLLRGIYAPRIIDEADQYFERQKSVIQGKGIRQSLRVAPVQLNDIVFDKSSQRVSVIVHGELELNLDAEARPRPLKIPFNAKMVLSPNVPSQINNFLFYAESIEPMPAVAGK